MKIKKHQITIAVYMISAFYGTLWITHKLLPKWVDIAVGLPASMILMYFGMLFYAKRYG